MSNEMVVLVARALCKANNINPDAKVDTVRTGCKFMWQLYINDAKAAIAAMRPWLDETKVNLDDISDNSTRS